MEVILLLQLPINTQIHLTYFPPAGGHLPVLQCLTLQHSSPFLHRLSLGNWGREINSGRG